jgi:two-component system OmpR family sensor kinase
MTHYRSIFRRLFVGLSTVSMLGTLLILVFIVKDHQESFRALGNPDAARHAFNELTEHVLVPIAVLSIPMAIASFLVIRNALRPLADAAAQLELTQAHARGVQVDHSAFPAEAVPFAAAVNMLLARLDKAARDHEAFAADIAHELRTPLAVLALELDGLDHPDAGRLKEEVATMRRLIDQLMLLAQVEAQTVAQSTPDRVSLEEVGADVVSLLAPQAIEDGKSISLVRVGEDAPVSGRRETIAAAIRNLVENALRVTPRGSGVTVLAGPGPSLRVKDGGAGLSADRLAEMVQRHRRADHASKDGAGLGLAIVSRIMAAYGGTLSTAPENRELILHFPA